MLLQDKPMLEQLQPFPQKPVLWQVVRKPQLSRPKSLHPPQGKEEKQAFHLPG